nr:hypothetical protein [Porphyromonas gulae]
MARVFAKTRTAIQSFPAREKIFRFRVE